MKHRLLRGWRDYHQPPHIDVDADPFNIRKALGFILLMLALVVGWAMLMGGM